MTKFLKNVLTHGLSIMNLVLYDIEYKLNYLETRR